MTTRRRSLIGGSIGLGLLSAGLLAGRLSKENVYNSPVPAAIAEQCACPCLDPRYTLKDFVLLMTGPNRCGPLWSDLDRDGDTDLRDFAYLVNGDQ